MRTLRVGSRGSRLALIQTEHVIKRLQSLSDFNFAIVKIKTSGDELNSLAAREMGSGTFEREIDEALLRGDVDLAVHSLKDVPTSLPPGVSVVAVPERISPCDAFISRKGSPLSSMPKGAIIGTSSPRRAAQLKCFRGDLEISHLRGNVDTRLKRLREGKYDGIVVAEAALIRLGLGGKWERMPIERFPTSPGQGALAITARSDDSDVKSLVQLINSPEAMEEVSIERSFLKAMRSGCSAPIGFTARVEGESVKIVCGFYAADGSNFRIFEFRFPRGAPEDTGRRVAELVLNNRELEWFWREFREG